MSWIERWLGKRRRAPEPPRGDPDRVAEVEAVLARLRPWLAADGGDVTLVEVAEGTVAVRFEGACRACFSRERTLGEALEPELRGALPWFEALRAV